MKAADTGDQPKATAYKHAALRVRHYPGQQVCGDVGAWWQSGQRRVLCIADGLGHGPEAARAAYRAIEYVGNHLDDSVPVLLAGCDVALRDTRGAAVGIVTMEGGRLTYGGVGNTRGMRVGVGTCRFSSDAGIVGAGSCRILVEATAVEVGDLVILFTDGVSERLSVPASTTLGQVNTGDLADQLLARWATGQDDAAVLVYQHMEVA